VNDATVGYSDSLASCFVKSGCQIFYHLIEHIWVHSNEVPKELMYTPCVRCPCLMSFSYILYLCLFNSHSLTFARALLFLCLLHFSVCPGLLDSSNSSNGSSRKGSVDVSAHPVGQPCQHSRPPSTTTTTSAWRQATVFSISTYGPRSISASSIFCTLLHFFFYRSMWQYYRTIAGLGRPSRLQRNRRATVARHLRDRRPNVLQQSHNIRMTDVQLSHDSRSY